MVYVCACCVWCACVHSVCMCVCVIGVCVYGVWCVRVHGLCMYVYVCGVYVCGMYVCARVHGICMYMHVYGVCMCVVYVHVHGVCLCVCGVCVGVCNCMCVVCVSVCGYVGPRGPGGTLDFLLSGTTSCQGVTTRDTSRYLKLFCALCWSLCSCVEQELHDAMSCFTSSSLLVSQHLQWHRRRAGAENDLLTE